MRSDEPLSLDIAHAHTLAFISFVDDPVRNMGKLSEVTNNWLTERTGALPNFGLYYCFGRYDAILDMYIPFEETAKFASRVKEVIHPASLSMVPLYDIEDPSEFVEDFRSPVKVYSFINWRVEPEILWHVVSRLNTNASRETYVTLSKLLGAYRYLVVTRGHRLSDTFQRVQKLRREAIGGISEISSTAALGWGLKDESDKRPIYAQVLLKLRRPGQPVIPSPDFQYERIVFGRYDLIVNIKVNSLANLLHEVLAIRRANRDLISETSTVLSYAVAERFDDVLPDVPGQLTYGEHEDGEQSPKRKKN